MRKLLTDRAKLVPLLVVAIVIAVGATLVIMLTNNSTGADTSKPSASAPAPASAGGGKTVKLRISNFAFAPPTVTVAAGTTVTWTNEDSTAHTATASNGRFDTGTIDPGQTKSFTFRKPGTYQYICSFHAFMHGTIVVK